MVPTETSEKFSVYWYSLVFYLVHFRRILISFFWYFLDYLIVHFGGSRGAYFGHFKNFKAILLIFHFWGILIILKVPRIFDHFKNFKGIFYFVHVPSCGNIFSKKKKSCKNNLV